jgi:hypothetical protein
LFVPGLVAGSQLVTFDGSRKVMVPPYVGVPSESHQCPVTEVVVAVVVAAVVVGCFVVVVVEVVVLVVVVDVAVEVVDLLQDASSKEATSKKLKHNQINLFFNSNS